MNDLFTEKALLQHLKAMHANLSHIPVGMLLQDQPVACIDGRKTDCIVGAPGGNAGLFVLLLASYEKTSETTLSLSVIRALFEAYLDHFSHFYKHTDHLALVNMQAMMVQTTSLAAFANRLDTAEEASAFLHNPPLAIRDELLDLLVQPNHIGCGHLRLMVEHPKEYEIRTELVTDLLKVFFERLWTGDPRLVFDTLEGIHEEEAIVNIIMPSEAEGKPRLMAISPQYDDQQVFIHHPQAVAYMLKEQADFLAATELVPLDNPETLLQQQQELADRQLHATIRYLAPDLPIYNVTMDADHVAIVDTTTS